jgi:GT2 family glycosyltransferase
MDSETERPDVSVVIVHYETPSLLATCLQAVRSSTGATVETFVIDNASRNFEAEGLADALRGVRVVRNSQNAGFAVASNQGLREAKGRYLLLLNPDTFVEPDTLQVLVRYLDEHPDVGCATARLVLDNGRLDLACRRSFPTPARSFYRMTLLSRVFPRSRRFGAYNLTYLDEHQEAEIDSPCGAFMMVRAGLRESVGLLDERYFMYGEDLDWAYRIKQAGWKIMYVPSARATHIKRAASRSNRVRTIRAFHQAMRIFYRDHYASGYPRPLSWVIYRAIDVREAIELVAARVSRSSRGAAA